jgi:transposase
MSDKSAEIVTGLVTKEGSHGRRTYSVAAKRALAELCRRPGVSVAAMALQHGVNANVLRRWVNKYCGVKPVGTQATAPGAAKLLPVTTSMPSSWRPTASSESCIEIVVRAATVPVRGAVDAHAPGVVIDCLVQRA